MDAQSLQAWAQVAGDVIAVGLGGFAVYQLKAALSQVDLLRQQVDLLADQVKLQRDDLALQREAIAEEAKRNRKRDELLDAQLHEARHRQRTLERQQAEQVQIRWSDSSGPPGAHTVPGGSFHSVWVINETPRPIREVRAGLRVGNEKYRYADSVRKIVSSVPQPMSEVRDYRIDILPSGEGFSFVFSYPAQQQASWAARFVDDGGREWQVNEEDQVPRALDPDMWMN